MRVKKKEDNFRIFDKNKLDMIKINEKEYPTKVSEMTLEQWVNVSDAVRQFEKEPILQMEAVLMAIGVPQKEIEEIEISFGKELYKQLEDNAEGLELVEEIEGYKLDLSTPLNVRTSKMIDKLYECGNTTLALIAFFYRDERLTNNEHFDKAHIKHKINKLKGLNASLFVVAVGSIMEYLTGETSKLVDESK